MMEENNVLLQVNHLRTSFFTSGGEIKAVNDVSFHVNKQEIIAIVGESGSGKSVTQMSVMQLVQSPPGKIIGGEVLFNGKNLLDYHTDSKEMLAMRGANISMIFQEPMTSLNPVYTVGNQISEVIRRHKKCTKKQSWDLGTIALASVGIPDPATRMKNYPFEMSGGMRQRVLIAIAAACNSKLIIADEPTTALDVTTQAQVMELLLHIVETMKTSIVIVTHNLGLVTRYAQRIYVMYAGRIVESGTTEDLLIHPAHPYTLGLLKSVPQLEAIERDLIPIEGSPPNLGNLPDYCAFAPRCPYATEKCKELPVPQLRQIDSNLHFTACHFDIAKEELS